MNKNTFKTVTLNKGELNIYDFGTIKLLAYKTNDFIDDEVFIVEKDGRAVIIESPCFFDNIKELTEYLNSLKVDGMLVAYHGAGAAFLPDVPKYATQNAADYSENGGGMPQGDCEKSDLFGYGHCQSAGRPDNGIKNRLAGSCRKPVFAYHLIKLVLSNGSFSGRPNCSLPSAILFIRNAIFLARVRMDCMPSASCAASPCSLPCTLFQYWPEATGMPEMVKNLLSSSKVAERPPRLAATTAAPTFIVLSNGVE